MKRNLMEAKEVNKLPAYKRGDFVKFLISELNATMIIKNNNCGIYVLDMSYGDFEDRFLEWASSFYDMNDEEEEEEYNESWITDGNFGEFWLRARNHTEDIHFVVYDRHKQKDEILIFNY